MTAGAADVREVTSDEFAGVLRVAEVPHRDDERLVDDAGDDRPLHVFELQEEIGDVGDEILARQGAEERTEDLIGERAAADAP